MGSQSKVEFGDNLEDRFGWPKSHSGPRDGNAMHIIALAPDNRALQQREEMGQLTSWNGRMEENAATYKERLVARVQR